MTSASVTLQAPAAAPRSIAWRSRLTEFLLLGGATLVLFPLAWLFQGSVGLEPSLDAVDFWAFHLALVINNPHFAVTYLLFYKDAKGRAFGRAFSPMQRARYLVAGLLIPLGLIAWAGGAIAAGSARANRASSPTTNRVSTRDVPPAEISGRVTPVTGSSPTT